MNYKSVARHIQSVEPLLIFNHKQPFGKLIRADSYGVDIGHFI